MSLRTNARIPRSGVAAALAWLATFSGAADAQTNLYREAVSREYSIHVEAGADHREVTSREWSLRVEGGRDAGEVVSRELSLVVSDAAAPPEVEEIAIVVSPTGDEVALDWTAYNPWQYGDVAEFRVYLSDAGPITDVSGLTPVLTTDGATTTATLTGLTTFTDHFLAVVAVDAGGNFEPLVSYTAAYVLSPEAVSREVSLFVGQEAVPPAKELVSREFDLAVAAASPPAAITEFDVTVSPLGDSATLDWSGYNQWEHAPIDRFEIFLSDTEPITDVGALTPFAVARGGETSITLDGLTPNTDHFFAVVPVDPLGTYDPAVNYGAAYVLSPEVVSREFSIRVDNDTVPGFHELVSRELSIVVPDAAPPPPVTGVDSGFLVETSPDTFGAVVLDFTSYNAPAVGDITGYDVYVGGSFFEDVTGLTPFASLPAGSQRQTLTGLAGGSINHFAVVAVDALGNFDPAVRSYSAQASISGVGEVENLAGTSTATTLSFTWDPPGDAAAFLDGYRIRLGADPPVDLPITETTFDATDLTPATGYPFRISTLDIFGNESPGTSINAATWLGAPPNLTLTLEGGEVVARWDAPEPSALVAFYRVYDGTSSFSDVSGLTPLTTTLATEVVLGDLAGVQDRWVAVTAVNELGDADPAVVAVQASKQSQTIDFPQPALAPSPIPLTATATSGLEVAFEVTPATTATLVDDGGPAVGILQGGPIDITATQDGDADWWPAPPVTRSLRLPPVISSFTSNGIEIGDGAVIGELDNLLRVTALDVDGIASAEFFLRPDGGSFSSIGIDGIPGDGLTAVLQTDAFTPGPHELKVVVETPGGVTAERLHPVTVQLLPPPAPVLASPLEGAEFESELVTITGTAQRGAEVRILRGGALVGGPVVAGPDGGFSVDVSLLAGDNALVARATNGAGTGPDSPPRTLILKSLLTLGLSPSSFTEGETATLTVGRNHAQGGVTVGLSASTFGQLQLPATVELPDGQLQTDVPVAAIDDLIAELDGGVVINTLAPGYRSASVAATVLDDDRPTLTLATNRSAIAEGSDPGGLIATVTRSPATDRSVAVVISSSDPDSLRAPVAAVIPAFGQSAEVIIETPDNALTDGDREVFLTASILDVTTDEPLSESNELSILVTDDDGPALSLEISRLALSEGTATLASVSRNGPTGSSLEVTLTSSDVGEASVPASVTIPSGSSAVSFAVTAVDDGTDDGNQPVLIDAAAPDFAQAQLAVTVTDLLLPDLAATGLEPPPDSRTEETVSFRYRVANQGPVGITGPIGVRVFLSRDALIDSGDRQLSAFDYAGGLAAGSYFEQTESFFTPRESGDYRLLVELDAAQSVAEILETNNVGATPVFSIEPAYTATVGTDTDIAPSGSPVVFNGQATVPGGGPAADRLVRIHLSVRGTTRTFDVQTDANGDFSETFMPLPGEGGVYSLGAAHPGTPEAPVQDSFALLGFRADPDELVVTPLRDGPEAAGTLRLTNLTDFPLESVSVEGVGLPSGLSVTGVQIGATGVDPLGTAVVEYRVAATVGAPPEAEGFVRVTSPEGSLLDVPLRVQVRESESRLARDPGTVRAGMIPGGQSFANFVIRNDGGVPTGPVEVLTPTAFDWLEVVSGSPLPSIPAGGEATVSLQLRPPDDFPLGLVTGTVLLRGADNALSVPFSIRAVSDGRGDLVVRCEDEYTYFASGNPPLAGATVRVIDPVTRLEVASGVSDVDGEVAFDDLDEGTYELRAAAADHATVRQTVQVAAGVDNQRTLFLQRSTVSYSWTVVPTQVEDRYRIVIESQFEANVPAPVITVEPTYIDLSEITGDSGQVNLTLTNHGLIAADNVRLNFASSTNWEIEAMTEKIPRMDARSEYVVPIRISRLNGGRAGGCGPAGQVNWSYLCGEFEVSGRAAVAFGGDGTSCPYARPGGEPVIGSGGPAGPGGTIHPTGSAAVGTCDPCVLKAIIDCAVSFFPSPTLTCIYAGARFRQDCGGHNYELNCIIDAFQFSGGCVCAQTIGRVNPAGGSACNALNCFIDLLQCIQGAGGGNARSYEEILETFDDRGRAIVALLECEVSMFGDAAWIDLLGTDGMTEFFTLYKAAMVGDAPATQRIDATEDAAMRASVIGQAHPVLVDELIARWNRTVDYWTAGILEIDDVPAGQSTDFLDATSFREADIRAVAAFDEAEAAGFIDPLDAFGTSLRDMFGFLSTGDGVCARVRLQIEQEAVMTRDAFGATLRLSNSGDMPLEDIDIQLRVLDLEGFEATDRFGVVGPETSGLSGGDVAGDSEGTWRWTLVPGQDAAPEEATVYEVLGEVRYTHKGEEVVLPLLPQAITVYPNPNLTLKYYHQRDVYSDDPFTDPIEPAVPFSLGVIVENSGAGPARNLSITSAQPEIIENEKGLLVDFRIIGAEIDGEDASPSLTADFGDVAPGEVKVGRWLITSTLQGLFLNYSAEFEHLDSFGGSRPSLIESVEIFETIRAVEALGAQDDGLPDFLVNATFDVLDLPDEIHLSDGSVEPVTPHLSANAGTPGPGNLSVTLDATGLGAGWGYLRVPEPGGGTHRLVSCVRSDGLVIPLDTNVWTTDRTFVGLGLRPVDEDLLHLVDFDSTGSYTLTYAVADDPDVTPPTSSVVALDPDSGSFIPVSWSGTDDSGVARYDLYVSIDGGPFQLWLERTADTSAFYAGQTGSSYGFYSIAIDAAGNEEAPKSIAEASTAVTLSNQPPVIDPVGPLSVNERGTLTRTMTADDPDGPESALSWSLLSDNPAITIHPETGLLRWITSEEDGGTSAEVTITVTDGDPQPLSDSIVLTLEVVETNSAPSLDPPGSRTLDVGDPLVVQLAASDGDLPAQVVRYRLASGQPSGMTLDPVSGLLEWTPGDEHEAQTFAVRVEAYDDQVPEGIATRTLYLEVLKKPGLPPAFAPFPSLVWQTDAVHQVTVTAVDPEGEPLTLSVDLGGLPAGWPSFRTTPGSGSGIFSWGTWGVAPGTYQIPLTASTDRQSVTTQLTVEIVDRPAYDDYGSWSAAYALDPLESLIDRAINPLGLDNLFIYAFGLDPRAGVAPGQLPPGPRPLDDAEGLRFVLPEGGLGRADLEYGVERSVGDLQSWQEVATKSGHAAWTGTGFTIEESPLHGGLTEVRVVTGPIPSGPVFLRLRVGFPGTDPSAFETWMTGFPTPESGPEDDANADGIANLLAWSLGHSSPLVLGPAEREALPRMVGTPSPRGYRVALLGGAKPDIRYLIETSTNLRQWRPAAVKRGTDAWFSDLPLDPAPAIPPDEAWDFGLPLGPGGFVRLRVDPLLAP